MDATSTKIADTSIDTALQTTGDATLSFRAPLVDLKRITALLARVSERKSYPVLANILIRVDATGTTLAATDLNVTAIVRTDWRGTRGGFMVNAKSFADVIKKLPPDDCEITRKGPTGLVIKSGSLTSILMGLPDRDFPKVPDDTSLAWHTCQAAELARGFDSVAYAVCTDETRFHLNGIKYENPTGEHATFVATDGHRLALTRIALSGAPTSGAIVPSKGAREIVKLLGEGKRKGTAEMCILRNHLFVRYGAVTLAVKLIDAQFPPYEQVIPTDHRNLVTVERKTLIAAVKRADVVCTETRGVRLDFDPDGYLKLTSDHPDVGESHETLVAEGRGKITIGANTRYLIDALGEIDDAYVTLAFGKELDPIVIRGTEHATGYSVQAAPHLNVTMPMRI